MKISEITSLISSALSLFILLAIVVLFKPFGDSKNSSVSAYYNGGEYFAGFVQNEGSLIRACEFSTGGEFLSCSKWFDSNSLKQGKNEGIKSIKYKANTL